MPPAIGPLQFGAAAGQLRSPREGARGSDRLTTPPADQQDDRRPRASVPAPPGAGVVPARPSLARSAGFLPAVRRPPPVSPSARLSGPSATVPSAGRADRPDA